MPKILFIAAHRIHRSPSQRFRFEQYFGFLESNGFTCHLSSIISEDGDKYFYSQGNYLKKTGILLRSLKIRFNNWMNYNQYDIVFVQREALMLGSTFFEKRIKSSKAKFVFDFDDSIWLMDTSDANKKFEWLKNPQKTAKNIGYCDMVFAGNNYLADYAKQFNSNVKIIPTTIDTNEYINAGNKILSEKIVIGWSGSITTIKHFEYAIDFLTIVKAKYGDKVKIHVIGDKNYTNDVLTITGQAWKKETELHDLSEFDIGIMPLPNDEWANGKCGLKGLQYMALEIPTIMSPVGVNTEIIQQGENGFLASTTSEWVDCISKLIESPELRLKMGKAARQTVLEKYSVEAQKQRYLDCFNELLS